MFNGVISGLELGSENVSSRYEKWLENNRVEFTEQQVLNFLGKRVSFDCEANNLAYAYCWIMKSLQDEGLDNETKL